MGTIINTHNKTMSIKIDINPGLKDLPVMELSKIREFQDDLKDLTEINYNKLKKSLLEQGLLLPFFLWGNPEDKQYYIMDGHQRRRVFTAEGFDPKKAPYILVPGKNREEAKQNLLVITSQYGTITQEGYDKFTVDLSDDWKQQTLHFDHLWREFKPTFDNNSLSNKSAAIKTDSTIKRPTTSDDSYLVYKLVMLKQNKTLLENKISKIKIEQNIDNDEEALMYIINQYN